jgi:hypothetical protein
LTVIHVLAADNTTQLYDDAEYVRVQSCFGHFEKRASALESGDVCRPDRRHAGHPYRRILQVRQVPAEGFHAKAQRR